MHQQARMSGDGLPASAVKSRVEAAIALHLAGLLPEARAASRLGLTLGELGLLLDPLRSVGLAPVPTAVDEDLTTTFLPIGRDAFTAPTFDDVVDACIASRAASGYLRVAAKDLLRCSCTSSCRPFGAVIFHVGRSGSTLLCNLLSKAFGWVTLREPEFANGLMLRMAASPGAAERERLAALLVRLLQSLGHGVRVGPDGRERTSILKLSSWNALLADTFLRGLGDVPLIVIARDPLATIASFLQSAPHWSEGSRSQATNDGDSRTRIEQACFLADMWNQIIDVTLLWPPERTLFVDYDHLVSSPRSVLKRISTHVGKAWGPLRPEVLSPVMMHYSKGAPSEKFDRGHRRRPLDRQLRRLVADLTARNRASLCARTMDDCDVC